MFPCDAPDRGPDINRGPVRHSGLPSATLAPILAAFAVKSFFDFVDRKLYFDFGCHRPRIAPVGSRMKLRLPMPITSVTSFMISAPSDFAF